MLDDAVKEFLILPTESCLPALLETYLRLNRLQHRCSNWSSDKQTVLPVLRIALRTAYSTYSRGASSISSSQRALLQKRLLQLLSAKDVADEVQQEASELVDILDCGKETLTETMLLDEDVLEVSLASCEEMRRWFAGEAPPDLAEDLSSPLLCPRTLQCALHRCKKQEKIRSPIPNTLYPGSQLLAKLVLSCPELVSSKSVLEIGAGYHGLPSMAALLAEARAVVATDVDPVALHQLRKNLAEVLIGRSIASAGDFDELTQMSNGLNEISVLRLDWCALPSIVPSFQVILASEIIHERWMAPAVLDVVCRFLQPGGVAIIVNAASYHRFGAEEFQQLLISDEQNAPGNSFVSKRFQIDGAMGGIDCENLSYDCYVLQRTPRSST